MRCLLSPVLGWLAVSMRVGFVSALRARHDATSVRPGPDDSVFSQALSCLRLTSPSLELRYPEDAEEHMEEIRRAMLPFQVEPVYGNTSRGPFHAENLWMRLYLRWQDAKAARSANLSDVFGPYVPIFTGWVDPWFSRAEGKGRFRYPKGFLPALRGVLRRDVPYITVSQSDAGITGEAVNPEEVQGIRMEEYPNLLVLSAGGYGQVPLPLWKGIPPGRSGPNRVFGAVSTEPRPVRDYFVSYVGSVTHAPKNMRAQMKEVIERYADQHGIEVGSAPTAGTWLRAGKGGTVFRKDVDFPSPPASRILFYNNHSSQSQMKNVWREVMMSSRFSLTPRGFGRTAYHLSEIITGGLIPVHVYTDVPWIPYREVYDTFGFHTDVAGLPALLDRLGSLSEEELRAREARARAHSQSHWNAEGMQQQILKFMTGRGPNGEPDAGDLLCQRLPSSARDADEDA